VRNSDAKLAGEAKVAGGGVRVALEETTPETTHHLSVAESQAKILPSSYLEVLRLREVAGESVELTVNDFGWLLSCYAGRRIHPIAWEVVTPTTGPFGLFTTHN
jgi:hypothetical protein